MTRRRSAAVTDRADPALWPTVAWPTLSGDQQKIFRAREEAVRLYCQRASLRAIEAATGVPFSSVRRLYERCLQTHADGRLQGLRALVPYEHVKSYRRSATSVRSGPAGKAGAFQQLLERHPELEVLIVHELQAHHVVLRDGPNGLVVSGLSALHKRFRLLCLELGLTQRDYPLVQHEQGIRSLAAAVKSIATRSFELAARAALSQKRSGGVRPNAEGLPLVATIPFDAVEFDGHRVDVRLRIVFERVAGVEESFEIDRVWLLSIIDICSRAILGYHIVLEPEYSRFDVLKTVERALVPWRPHTLTIPGLRFASGAGMPSERFPELGYALWNLFRFDNAKANLAEDTLRVLTDIVGCGVHAGPAYRPNERPHIERFFGTLASVLAHRLPGTTGTGPADPRRHLAELTGTAPAVVRLDELMELTAVAISNYNAASHTSLGGRSPLEMLGYYLREKQSALRWLAEPMRRNLCLLQHEHEGHVRGSIVKGVRPYIHFFGARYTSHALAGRANLIGKPVLLYFDTEDVRALRVFDAAGRELCVVEVQGAWRYTAHTLRMRKEILSLVRARKLHIAYNDDPVQCYLDYLRHSAARRRRSASKAEITRRAIDAAAPVPKAPPGPADKKAQFDCATAPVAAPSEEAQKAKSPVKGKRLVIGSGQVFSR